MKKLSLIVAMCGLCAIAKAQQAEDFISPLASNMDTSIVTMSDISEDSDIIVNDPISLSPSSSCLVDQVVTGSKTFYFSGPPYIIINMIGDYPYSGLPFNVTVTGNQNQYWTGKMEYSTGHYEIWHATPPTAASAVSWQINVYTEQAKAVRVHIDPFDPSYK